MVINSEYALTQVQVFTIDGKLIRDISTNEHSVALKGLPAKNIFLVRIAGQNGLVSQQKVFVP